MISGYRCFLYDAAVLIAARLELENHPKTYSNINIGTNDNQLAIESTLIKIRSLYDFFSGKPQKDDIHCSDFDFKLKILNDLQSKFKNSINKYAMHLTWERVDRINFRLPKIDDIIDRCKEIEVWIREFIEHCEQNRITPKGRGKKYLDFIVKHSEKIYQR